MTDSQDKELWRNAIRTGDRDQSGEASFDTGTVQILRKFQYFG